MSCNHSGNQQVKNNNIRNKRKTGGVTKKRNIVRNKIRNIENRNYKANNDENNNKIKRFKRMVIKREIFKPVKGE